MEDWNCRHCSIEAKYLCSCQEPKIALCRDHHDEHLDTEGRHVIELYKSSIYLISSSKKLILSKIVELKNEALENVNRVVNHTAKLTTSIEMQAKEVIDRLRNFMMTCDKKIVEIMNIVTITKKNFYSPLEKALISGRPSNFINTLIGSDIILHESVKAITYIPSLLEHSFQNYSSFTAGFNSESSIIVYPPEKIFPSENTNWLSRILAIDFNLLLITGGCLNKIPHSNCYTLNIESGTISNAPSMNRKRSCHAITWLKGFPYVIGGLDEDGDAGKSSEYLIGDKWIEIAPLNIGRFNFPAVNHKGIIWCLATNRAFFCLIGFSFGGPDFS